VTEHDVTGAKAKLAATGVSMNVAAVMLSALIATILVLIGLAVLIFYSFRRVWLWTKPDQLILRSLIGMLGIGCIIAPYVAFKISERSMLLARVPEPLQVAAIEYRLEESYGMGFMPGDNEAGLVIYRLTDASTQWARNQGDRLDRMLEDAKGTWRTTPVDDRGDEKDAYTWHSGDLDALEHTAENTIRHFPNIREYFGKYGSDISIEEERTREIDEAIQSGGSVYRYIGDSITVVDPKNGKVYFFYSG
jgi:hypothetical protein